MIQLQTIEIASSIFFVIFTGLLIWVYFSNELMKVLSLVSYVDVGYLFNPHNVHSKT